MKPQPPTPKLPTSQALAATYGFELRDPLPKGQTRRLRRALPGGESVLREAGEVMAKTGDAVRVRNTTPEKIAELVDRRHKLSQAEAVLERAHRSAYEQRLQADDQIVDLLRKVDRSVKGTEDPELILKFKFLREFLAQFSGGRPKKGAKKKAKKKAGKKAGAAKARAASSTR